MTIKSVATSKTLQAFCKQCNISFFKKGQNNTFCSTDCYVLFYKDYNLEARKNYIKANPAQQILKTARHRAKKRGLPFNLDISDIVLPEKCPILKLPLKLNMGTGAGGRNDSYSLDRIIPSLGYVKGNVQVISHKANSMKYSASPEELLLFAEWINKTYGK